MVGVFGRKKDSQDSASTTLDASPATAEEQSGPAVNPAEAKKNRPTPKRSQQVAKNRQPLVGGDRKKADKAAKAEMRRRRDEARIGVMNGEEKYLGPRDAGPQRRYVRDFIDARFSMGELFIPVALIVLIVGMFNQQAAMIANIVVYGLILLVVLDSFVLTYQLKGRLEAKFGEGKIQKGTNFYAIMRAIQLRRLRVPKPMVARREYPQ